MRFAVDHTTHYHFNQPVFLEPHQIRLRPLEHSAQRLLDYRLSIAPEPEGTSTHLDAEGNPVTEAWFSGLTSSLLIRSELHIETGRANPFDFILTDDRVASLPAQYPVDVQPPLALYRRRRSRSQGVHDCAARLTQQAEGQTLAFLAQACEWLYRNIEVVIRLSGDPLPPAETLRRRRGSCRDLTVLFMELCRTQGLAARFVSGYQIGDPGQEERHLHAWSEVYLPGGGWRGYDPTHGLAVAAQHVALAASWHSHGAAPVTGAVRGDAAAELDYAIRITDG